MFAKNSKDELKIIGEKQENMLSTLEAGIYNVKERETFFGYEHFLTKVTRYDETEVAPVGIFKDIYDYTMSFFNESRIRLRKEMKMMNKMNLLLKGDPGTGKTHLAATIASEIIKKENGIGLIVNKVGHIRFDEFIDKIRINEPNRFIVIVLDELEKNPHHRLVDSDFLSFLDGSKSRENVIILATVNSLSEFPNYLINRPGRFERIYDFVFNTEEVLEQLTKVLIPGRYKDNKAVIDTIVERAITAKVKTIDHLRFGIIDYLTALETDTLTELPTTKEKVVVEKLESVDNKDLEESVFAQAIKEAYEGTLLKASPSEN